MRRPQLIVPPQINKYYIFDLSEGKSIVEYLVKSEFQVFVVSWRNPTAAQSHWALDTYVTALLEAIAAVRDITGSDDINLHGACSGAMTISALLGYLASRGDKSVNAATLMVAVLDNTADSQLGLFATPEAVAAAKQASASQGVLAGEEMGRVFAWMRPNDLVWNYWVNNYLMGKTPPAFDILYWNNDTTRLPARLHGQLLDIFMGNLFSEAWRAERPRHADRPVRSDVRQVRGGRHHRSHHALEGCLQHGPAVRRRYAVRAEFERPHPEPDQSAGQSEGEVLPQS